MARTKTTKKTKTKTVKADSSTTQLIATAKDMNEVMGLDPEIDTDAVGTAVKALVKEIKTNASEAETEDKFQDSTWEILTQLGVNPKDEDSDADEDEEESDDDDDEDEEEDSSDSKDDKEDADEDEDEDEDEEEEEDKDEEEDADKSKSESDDDSEEEEDEDEDDEEEEDADDDEDEPPVEKKKEKKKEAKKEKKAKKAKAETTKLGSRLGSQAAFIDELLLAGTTEKDLIKKFRKKYDAKEAKAKGRIKLHFNYLEKSKGIKIVVGKKTGKLKIKRSK